MEDDIDRQLALQLARRADRYREVEDDELEAEEVDDQLGELREAGNPVPGGSRPAWFTTARAAANRFRRSVSVELELEGADPPRESAQDEELLQSSFKGKGKAREVDTADRPEDSHEDKCCRMCLGEEGETGDDGQTLGPLIAPCSCKGSMKWVHAKCLYRWRATSSSPSGANTCGQCHFRYRLKPPWGGAKVVWALNCQPLRVILAITAVTVAAMLSGMIAAHTLQGAGKVPVIRDVLLYSLKDPAPPYRIRLLDDKPTIQVEHSLFSPHDPIYLQSAQPDILARASIDAFNLVQQQKRGDPVWYDMDALREARDQSKGIKTNIAAPTKNLVSVSDVGDFVSRSYRTARKNLKRTWKITFSGKGQLESTAAVSSKRSENVAGTHTTGDFRRQLPSDLSSSIEHTVYSPDPSSDDPELRSGNAVIGMRGVAIEHSFPALLDPYGDPADSVLVRYFPESWGALRYVPFGFYVYVRYSLLTMLHIFRRVFTGLSRASIGALEACSSRRGLLEIVWLLAKVAVSAACAYLAEEIQAAVPLPKMIPGAVQPYRSRERVLAGHVRFILVTASDVVFGPHWVNWWGGYSLSIYLKPVATSWSMMESLVFMQTVSGPTLPILADGLASLLEYFSELGTWIRETHTRGWLEADWTRTDASASEGYRRLMSGLLGDERSIKVSRYDIYLAKRGGRVLTGRVRPINLASLVGEARTSWAAYFKLSLTLGMLVVVAAATSWMLYWAFQELLRSWLLQIRGNLQHLVRLIVQHEWIRQWRATMRSFRRRRRGAAARRSRGVRARLDPMLEEDAATPPPGAEDPAQVDPAAAVPIQPGANLVVDVGGVAIGVLVGPPAPAHHDLQGNTEQESRWSLVLADLMAIYGSCQVILNTLRMVALITPSAPFVYFYRHLRNLEKHSRVQRDVMDLSHQFGS